MRQLNTNSTVERYLSLDSIRGIASLAVLLGHTLAVFVWDVSYSRLPVLNNLFDGRSAVTMFFVLSGFVLTVNLLKPAGSKEARKQGSKEARKQGSWNWCHSLQGG